MTVHLHDQPGVYLILAAFLLAAGIYGLIRRRTLIAGGGATTIFGGGLR